MEEIEKFAELVKAINGVADTKMLALALKASKFCDDVKVEDNLVVTIQTPVIYTQNIFPSYIQPFYDKGWKITCGDGITTTSTGGNCSVTTKNVDKQNCL